VTGNEIIVKRERRTEQVGFFVSAASLLQLHSRIEQPAASLACCDVDAIPAIRCKPSRRPGETARVLSSGKG
jgi:hypothetical protein